MSATIVSIDRMPCVLQGEPNNNRYEQQSLIDRWLFEPSHDCTGLTLRDYRQRLALHTELARFLQSGTSSVNSNLKLMKKLTRLHQQMRAALEARGMA